MQFPTGETTENEMRTFIIFCKTSEVKHGKKYSLNSLHPYTLQQSL